MAYEKQNFKSGQKLKAAELNHMEDGIVNAVSVTEQTLSEAQKAQARKNLDIDDIAAGNGIDEITIESVGETESNPSEAVLFTEQYLTEEQKAQARENIGVADTDEIVSAVISALPIYNGEVEEV